MATEIGPLLARAIEAEAKAAGCAVNVRAIDAERWASATFCGARHRLCIEASAAGETLDAWLASLPESEFSIAGHLVADLAAHAVRHGDDRTEIDLEILTLEDG